MLSDRIWLEIYTLLTYRKQHVLHDIAEPTGAEVLLGAASQTSCKAKSHTSQCGLLTDSHHKRLPNTSYYYFLCLQKSCCSAWALKGWLCYGCKVTQAFYRNLVWINVPLQSMKLKQSVFLSHVTEINAVNKHVYWKIYFGGFFLFFLQTGLTWIPCTMEIQQNLYYPSVSLLHQYQIFNQNRLNCTTCSKDQYKDMVPASKNF